MAESVSEEKRPAPSMPYTLPSIATMTQGMPPNESSPKNPPSSFEARDSGNWSMQSQSKHSSTISSNPGGNPGGLHLQTILNSEDSPNRFSASSGTPSSAKYPSGNPPTSNQLPTLNQGIDNRASVDAGSTSFLDSRRSSIDSRVNAGIGHLAINPTSPYESTNASQASLASSLQHQRGIHTPIQPKVNGSTPLSPIGRGPLRTGGRPPVRAPPIVAPSRSADGPDPTASSPTKGFAWAFPDNPDDDMEGSSPGSSRQGSLAASSINTMDSSAYPGHHHSLQHKSVTTLQGETSSIGSGSYSRTPELRVSHKLAERKRRSEMKDLFEGLNRILPNSPGNKSSKWEILTKAIDYVSHLKEVCERSQREVTELRTEIERARGAMEENRQCQSEITAMYQQLLRVDPHGHHVFGPKTHALNQQETQTPNRLPPMQQSGPSQSSWMGSGNGAAMQGVEYGNSSYDHR